MKENFGEPINMPYEFLDPPKVSYVTASVGGRASSEVVLYKVIKGKVIDRIVGYDTEGNMHDGRILPGDRKFEFEGKWGRLVFYHAQDYCEFVRVEEVIGDINDLIGSTVIEAESISGGEEMNAVVEGLNRMLDESYTWTFYKFGTMKGFVTIRWLSESSEGYSHNVSVKYIKAEE